MNPLRKQKLMIIFFLLGVLIAVTLLVTYALRQNINLFYTPTQIAQGEAMLGKEIRLGGMVAKNSVKRANNDLMVEFEITDFHQNILVHYRGILPDLFREGQGIVAKGKLIDQHHFQALEILAKHDANYMPPQVRQSLAAQNGDKQSS